MVSLEAQPADRNGPRDRPKLALLGRYMLPSRREYPCQSVEISPYEARLIAPAPALVGERVVVYLDLIGRFEGEMTRSAANGFVMTIRASDRKRTKLAVRIAELAERGLPDETGRRPAAPRDEVARLVTDDGEAHEVGVLDVSLIGATVLTPLSLPIGARVRLGRTTGRVTRRLEAGLAIEFDQPQDRDRLTGQIY